MIQSVISMQMESKKDRANPPPKSKSSQQHSLLAGSLSPLTVCAETESCLLLLEISQHPASIPPVQARTQNQGYSSVQNMIPTYRSTVPTHSNCVFKGMSPSSYMSLFCNCSVNVHG